jgi:hypothetical protein
VCQVLNPQAARTWTTDSFADPRAEDQVDEHHGLEDSSQAAEAPIAAVVCTSIGSHCARINKLLATASQCARLLD